MKPITTEPISHEVGGSYGSGFILGAIESTDSIGYVYSYSGIVTIFKGEGTWNRGASVILLAFIAKAEAYYRPLVELPVTMDDVIDIAKKWNNSGSSMKDILASKGFKCKD